MATAEHFPEKCKASEARRSHLRRLCRRFTREAHVQGEDGIGTLAEKRMHVILKHLFCDDESLHEIKMEGTRFVADVRVGNEIYEIQTGPLAPLRKKIEYYLKETDCTVTVVHPIPVKRWSVRINKETREISEKKRIPSFARDADLLAELFSLRDLLPHPRLSFHLLYLETLDFRVLSKKGTRGRGEKYERIPLDLLGEEVFSSPADFSRFLPAALPSPFTVKELSTATGLRGLDAYSAARTLLSLGLIKEGEKRGRAMTFDKV